MEPAKAEWRPSQQGTCGLCERLQIVELPARHSLPLQLQTTIAVNIARDLQQGARSWLGNGWCTSRKQTCCSRGGEPAAKRRGE